MGRGERREEEGRRGEKSYNVAAESAVEVPLAFTWFLFCEFKHENHVSQSLICQKVTFEIVCSCMFQL
jgi:hypothetical protein